MRRMFFLWERILLTVERGRAVCRRARRKPLPLARLLALVAAALWLSVLWYTPSSALSRAEPEPPLRFGEIQWYVPPPRGG